MKRLFFLSVALLTVWAAAAQVRFVDATTLNLILPCTAKISDQMRIFF